MNTMTGTKALALLLVTGALACPGAASEEPPPCPLHAHQAAAQQDHAGHAGHAEHFAGVDRRGDEVMGFSHHKTGHQFLIEPEGGTVHVTVQNPGDTESLGQIRTHLADVARQLAAGDFSMPKEIHGRVLPGVPEMIERKDAITYRYEDVENGGRVVIRTSDPEALAAIHAFLQAQIGDHRTGDPTH
jgi:hypothetical protein